MKNRSNLKPKYGKLTVKDSYVENGRYLTVVQCECGRTKSVFTSALRAGRTRSCGSVICRSRKAHLPAPRTHVGHGLPAAGRPRHIRLRQIWRRITEDGETVASVAEDLSIPAHSLYYLVSRIKAKGGVNQYIEWESKK